MAHYGTERDDLARALMEDDALRHEVTDIGQRGVTGRPSDRYIQWKHRLNELARHLGISTKDMLESVIDRAIDLTKS